MTREETYHALLMEYASGCLDEAQALVVATHMSLSPAARKIVAGYESIGGSMLKECCDPVPMTSGALQSVMDRIEKLEKPQSCTEKLKKKCGDKDLPTCLAGYMETKTWASGPQGHEFIHVKTTCCGYTAQLMKLAPDAALGKPAHRQVELTVVLEGTFTDGTESYKRGDLIVIERTHTKPLRADAKQGAVCFIVRPAGSTFRQFALALLPFLSRKD